MTGGQTYQFVSWSDGGAATHSISTPTSDTIYAATFQVAGGGLSATYFSNMDLTGTTVTLPIVGGRKTFYSAMPAR